MSGTLCECSILQSSPEIEDKGFFTLLLGGEETSLISYGASSEEVASALEALELVEAVSATRSTPGLMGNFTWFVTFFALSTSVSSEVSLLESQNFPNEKYMDYILAQNLSSAYQPAIHIEITSSGNGASRVFCIETVAQQMDAVIQIDMMSTSQRVVYFYLNISMDNYSDLVGPIYPFTVPMSQDETIGPYPPHSQPEGTEVGQSIQSLFKSLPFFFNLATDVEVSKTVFETHNTWAVSFVGGRFSNISVQAVLSSAVISSDVVILINQSVSPVSVADTIFSLAYNGHVTSPLLFNSSSEAVRSALMSLVTISNPLMGVGSVQVGRRGPNNEGGFKWYVSVTQEAESIAGLPLTAHVILRVGGATNIFVRVLRTPAIPVNSGLFLQNAGFNDRAITNLVPSSSLFNPGPRIFYSSNSLAGIISALESITYSPPPQWTGGVTFVITIGNSFLPSNASLIKSVGIQYIPVLPPAAILWGNVIANDASTLLVLEDIPQPLIGLSIEDMFAGSSLYSVVLSTKRGYLIDGFGAATMNLYLSGGFIEINQRLSAVLYLSCLDCYGQDKLSIALSRETDQAVVSQIVVTISPYNDPPFIYLANTSTYGLLYSNESSWEVGHFSFDANTDVSFGTLITIFDVDYESGLLAVTGEEAYVDQRVIDSLVFAAHLMQLEVEASMGTFFSLSPSSVQVLAGNLIRGSSSLRLVGSLSDLQMTLSSLVYRPLPNWDGIDLVTVTVDDLGGVGHGGSMTCLRRLLLEFDRVPFAPTISLPSSIPLISFEDTTGVIGRDPGTESLQTLFLSETSIQVMDRNVPLKNFTGRVIEAVDTREFSGYGSIIANTTYTAPTSPYQIYASVEPSAMLNSNFTLRLEVNHGTVSLAHAPSTLDFTVGGGYQDDVMEFSGTLIDVNVALEGLEYTPDLNWNSFRGADEFISVTATNNEGLSAFMSVPILVQAVNDGPILYVDKVSVLDSLHVTTDQVSHMRSEVKPLLCLKNIACALPDIIIRDVDLDPADRAGSLLFEMSCSNGTFYFDPAENDAFSIYQSQLWTVKGSRSVHIMLPWTKVDMALGGIYYKSDPGDVGADAVLISVNDLGNYGVGGPLYDSLLLKVIIEELALEPVVHIPDRVIHAVEGSTISIRFVVLAILSRSSM